jgi:signal transduction histidine kinase
LPSKQTESEVRPVDILIVDDRPENLLALEAVIEPLNVNIIRADSGEAALKEVLHNPEIALVLLDVQMPGLDGLQTAELIKTRKASSHIPIIFITAISRETAYVVRSYGQGAVDYLLKPVDPDILRSKVSVFVELYRRGEQLRRQAATLAAAEAKDAFLLSVAHELRTPLAAAKAQAQLAIKQLGDSQQGPGRALAIISRQIDRLARLVSDLLDINRLEGGHLKLQLESFDLRPLLEEIRDRMMSLSSAHSISIVAPPNLLMTADPNRLEQVVVNLLSNAQRYSPKGGEIVVEAKVEGDQLSLSVSDQGIGVPKEMQSLIFERFGTAHGSAFGGLGLGLTIARGIVEQHGGEIRVESDGNEEGSTFRIRVPLHSHLQSRQSA